MSKQRYRREDSGLLLPFPDVWVPREPRRDRRRIDHRRWMPGYPCCCDGCEACNGGRTPAELLITIAGGTQCSEFNGTFAAVFIYCQNNWSAPFNPNGADWDGFTTAGVLRHYARFTYADTSQYPEVHIGVQVIWEPNQNNRAILVHCRNYAPFACCGGDELGYQLREDDVDAPYNCRAFSSLNIPAVESFTSCPEWAATTASITSV